MKKLHLSVLIVTLLLLGGLVGYALVKNSYLPVARVEGALLWFKTVEENAVAAGRLQESGLAAVQVESDEAELFKKAFESLIINTAVKSRASSNARGEAEKTVSDYLVAAEGDLTASVKAVYGWDMETFKKRVLEPAALEEALLKEHGEKYKEWFGNVRESAKVNIWFLPFEWVDGELKGK